MKNIPQYGSDEYLAERERVREVIRLAQESHRVLEDVARSYREMSELLTKNEDALRSFGK